MSFFVVKDVGGWVSTSVDCGKLEKLEVLVYTCSCLLEVEGEQEV